MGELLCTDIVCVDKIKNEFKLYFINFKESTYFDGDRYIYLQEFIPKQYSYLLNNQIKIIENIYNINYHNLSKDYILDKENNVLSKLRDFKVPKRFMPKESKIEFMQFFVKIDTLNTKEIIESTRNKKHVYKLEVNNYFKQRKFKSYMVAKKWIDMVKKKNKDKKIRN